MLWCLSWFHFAQAKNIQSIQVGFSESLRPIYAEKIGQGEQTILIIATIHGNEWSGYPLIRSFLENFDHNTKKENISLVLLPIANPDAFAIAERNNLNWVDINRNFPAKNYGKSRRDGTSSFSENESIIIQNIVDTYQIDGIVVFHEPFACIDYNGPAKEWAEYVGQHSDLPVKKLSEMSGSIGSYFGNNKNIPVLTIELPSYSHAKSVEYLWDTYQTLFLTSISFWKVD